MQPFSNGLASNERGMDGNVDRDRAVLNYIRKSLRATWPWTRLLSVLGFIGILDLVSIVLTALGVIAAILIPTLMTLRG